MGLDHARSGHFRRFGAVAAVAGSLAASIGGCGSRGPLDDSPFVTGSDASIATDAGPESSQVDAALDASAVDAGGGSAVACGICVISTCGSTILSCVQDEACRAVFQCVATTCLGGGSGGGGLDSTCLFKCAGNDPAGALGVLSTFQCLTGDCGTDCRSVLDGLGRLLPGGSVPGGGGPGGGGRDERESVDPRAFAEVFAPWPELFSPSKPNSSRRYP